MGRNDIASKIQAASGNTPRTPAGASQRVGAAAMNRPASAGASRSQQQQQQLAPKSGSKHIDPMSLSGGATRQPIGSQLAPTRRSAQRGNGSRLQRGESLSQRTVRLANEFANVLQRDDDLPVVEQYAPAGFKPQLDEDPSIMSRNNNNNFLRNNRSQAASTASVSKLSNVTQPSTSSGVKPYTAAAARSRSPKLATGPAVQQQQQPRTPKTTERQQRVVIDPHEQGRTLHGNANESTGHNLKRQAKELVQGPPEPEWRHASQATGAPKKQATAKPTALSRVHETDDAPVQGPKKEPIGHKLTRKVKEFAHAVAHPGGHHHKNDTEPARQHQQFHQHAHEQSLSDSMPAPRDAHEAPKPMPGAQQLHHQHHQADSISPSYQRPTAASSGRVAHAAEERKFREHVIQQRKEGIAG